MYPILSSSITDHNIGVPDFVAACTMSVGKLIGECSLLVAWLQRCRVLAEPVATYTKGLGREGCNQSIYI